MKTTDADATELQELLGEHDVLSHFSDVYDRDVWVVERWAWRSVIRRELDGELRVFASEAEYDENVVLEAPREE